MTGPAPINRRAFIRSASVGLLAVTGFAGASAAEQRPFGALRRSGTAIAASGALPAAAPFGAPRDFPVVAASQPNGLLVSRNGGALWFAATNLGALGRLDRVSGAITYFPLGSGAHPSAITEAPALGIIAADRGLNVLHRLDPNTGTATRIAMPADLPFLDIANVRVDAEGKIWFSGASGWLGSHDPETAQTDVSSHDDLQGLALAATAPDGTIWFVAGKSARMIHIDPQKRRFDSAALPPDFHAIRGVAVGPKGEVWLSSMKNAELARYAGRGAWSTFFLPWSDARPQALTVRADGTVIVADAGRRRLIRFLPETGRFEDVGELGAGGAIKAMVDLGDAIAITDMGADLIRIFPDEPPKAN